MASVGDFPCSHEIPGTLPLAKYHSIVLNPTLNAINAIWCISIFVAIAWHGTYLEQTGRVSQTEAQLLFCHLMDVSCMKCSNKVLH